MNPGMVGDDIAELQNALVRLGFSPDVDGRFGDATKAAVTSWYESNGFTPMWSDVSAADVAAALAALNEAEAAFRATDLALTRLEQSDSGVTAAQAAVNEANRLLANANAAKPEAVMYAQVLLDNAQAAYDRLLADPESSTGERESAFASVVAAKNGLAAAIREGDYAIAAALDSLAVAASQLDEAQGSGEVTAARAARDNARTIRDAAAVAWMTALEATGPTLPLGEVVFVPELPARVRSAITALGPIAATGVSADAGLVDLEAGNLVVRTFIRTGDEGFVRVGMPVELLDETTNTGYPASVVSVAEKPTMDPSGVLGREAVVLPNEALPSSLTAVNLRITITSAASAGPVLVVPLAAVSAGADGATRVAVLRTEGSEPVQVEVHAGISGNGFVAVTPVQAGALSRGELVVVGR